MKNKRLLALTITIMTASMLVVSGCRNKQEAEPVTAETTEEPETETMEEPEEEPEENGYSVNAIDGLNEGTTIGRDTGSSEESTTSIDSLQFIESGATGVDTQDTDALIAEYESESADIYINPEGMDENHDGRGFNKTTGEYDKYYDTNNGQGWDRNGKHYRTLGEYHDSPEMKQGTLTPEELEISNKADEIMRTNRNGVRYIYDDDGRLIDAVPNNPNE